MNIYTHGDEIDPRRDGCDSCTDLRAELERQSALLHDSRAEVDRLRAANQQLRAGLERVIATLRVATPDNTLVVGGQEVVSLTDPQDV